MNLRDLPRAIALSEARTPLLQQLELCTAGWGDYWYAAYQYRGEDEPKRGRFKIPMTLVKEELQRQIDANTSMLRAIGVEIE